MVIALVAALLVLVAGGVVARVVVRGRPVAVRELLPPDTLLAVGLRAFDDPAWVRVVSLLQHYPGAENLSADALSASLKRAQEQVFRGSEQPVAIPPFTDELLFAVLPKAPDKSSNVKGGKELESDLLVLAAVTDENAAREFANAIVAEVGLVREGTYRGIPVWQAPQTAGRTGKPLYAAYVRSVLAASTHPSVLQRVIDGVLGRGFGGRSPSLARSESFRQAAARVPTKDAVAWVLVPNLRALVEATGASPVPRLPTAGFVGVSLVADADAFLVKSLAVGPDTARLPTYPLRSGLLAKVPEQLAGQWVSYFAEQRDLPAVLAAAGVDLGSAKKTLEEALSALGVRSELLAFAFQSLLPALKGQTAVLVAPYADGRSPIIALVGELAPTEAAALEGATQALFAALAQPGPLGGALRRDRIMGGVKVRSIEAPTPEVRQALGVSELAAAFPPGYVILGTHAEAVGELVRALVEDAGRRLADNPLVNEQLEGRPDTVTAFTYVFPGGLPGLLYGFLCDRLPDLCAQDTAVQPTIRAALDAATMLLRVTRTVGTHWEVGPDGLESLTRIRMTPLAPTERASYETAVAQLKQFTQALQQSGALQQLAPQLRTPTPPQVRGEQGGE